MNIKQKQWLDQFLGYFLIVVFVPLTRLLGISMKRNHNTDTQPDTIVFIKILGLGSMVMATALIKATKEKYPKTNIILLTDKNIADGIRPFLPDIEILSIDSSHAADVLIQPWKLLFKFWSSGRLWICDLEVYSKLTTLFSLFSCASNRFGFVLHPVQFRNYLNTHNIYYNAFHNMEANYAAFASALGITYGDVPINCRKSRNYNFIAINNTCSELSIYRKMTEQTLLTTIDWILTHTFYKIALCGSPKDFEQNETLILKFANQWPIERFLNMAAKFDFPGYYDFLETECELMLSVDSAPLHIAKKLGLPTVSIWGPTNPASYMNINKHEIHLHLTIYNAVMCSPCVHHTKHLPCGGNNFCMKEISSLAITTQLKALLENIKS